MSEDTPVAKKEGTKEKPRPPSLDYFTLTGKTEKGFKVYTCTFCQTTLTQKITRFNEHLLLRCPKITQEAKNDLSVRLPDGVNTRIHASTPRRSNKRRQTDTESDDTESDEDVLIDTSGNNVAEKAVQLLTGLLSKGGTFLTDDRPKKKLSSMTMAELDREENITRIELARTKMQNLQESIKKYENLNENFNVVVEATKEMINVSKDQLKSVNTFQIM